MMTDVMTGGCRVTICGIPYWAAWSEGQVVFSHIDGFYGHGMRIVISKPDPSALLYVEIAENLNGRVPACHIARAAEIAAEVLGPDHFRSLEGEEEYHRNRPLFRLHRLNGFRSGLLEFKGKRLFGWGAWKKRKKERRLVSTER